MTSAPNLPGAVSLVPGGGGALIVSWVPAVVDTTHGAATGYNLQSSLSGLGQWTTIAGPSSPYDLSGLPGATAIDVQVQSVNAVGSSGWTATVTATTGTFAPNAPSAPTLANGSSSDLIVTWTAPTVDGTHGAAATYNLRSSPSGANTWTTVTGVVSPYDLTGLTAGAAFDVQVEGVNAGASGAWSATSTRTTTAAGP